MIKPLSSDEEYNYPRKAITKDVPATMSANNRSIIKWLNFLPLCILAVFSVYGGPDVRIRVLRERRTSKKAQELGGVVHLAQNGDLYFLSVEQRKVHRFSNGAFTKIPLSKTPEDESSNVSLMQSLDVDKDGNIYVPAIWRLQPKGGGGGVFVFDAGGTYQKTIPLNPGVGVRHIALDSSGNLIVLGINPQFFLNRESKCLMLHKYDPQGNRLTGFSPCPTVGRQTSGPEWDRLNLEADRGDVWVKGALVYQLLPVAHQIRIFDGADGGRWVGAIPLEAPQGSAQSAVPGDPATLLAWRVLPVGPKAFLVDWRARQGAVVQRRSRVMAMHGARGSVLSELTDPAWVRAIPIAADENGRVFFVAQDAADGSVRVLQTEPVVN